jgi:UDP-glucose 4-epimerase
MLSGTPPTIFGDGMQSRDFTYIGNVVDANILAGWAPTGKVNGKVYNIATGERHSLIDVYSTLAELLSFEEAPVFRAPRTGDIQHSLADITNARLDLGYRPETTFSEGLNRTVEWYRDNLETVLLSPRDLQIALPQG